MKSLLRNLKLLFTDDFGNRWQTQTHEFSERSAEMVARMSELETALNVRADNYEKAVDTRLDERMAALDARVETQRQTIETRLDEYQAALDARIEERLIALETSVNKQLSAGELKADARADAYEKELTRRTEVYEKTINSRLDGFETSTSARLSEFEAGIDQRAEQRFVDAEKRLDERLETAEERLDSATTEGLRILDERFDERERKSDIRFDDRLVRTERYIDSRFDAFEKRTDARLETHERTVDGKLHQRSQDIIDRTDLMLQAFDQRLDKFRRELRSSGEFTSESSNGERSVKRSFRKLSEAEEHLLKQSANDSPPLYHQILDWKREAHEGIYTFTPDEQEIVDYLLSFQEDPPELAYVKHHMRRFLTTIKRIPPAGTSEDRILELGSLGHLAPAIKKYAGYQHFYGGDSWNEDEKTSTIVVQRPDGSERVEFELKNFNVETDPFPYPDGFFHTVLCCELLEHLLRDPMHMLWECNRVLENDGYLLVSTPNISSCQAIEGVLTLCTPYHFAQYNLKDRADQHNREYSPIELQWALEAAGFTVVLMETEDVWMRSNPAILELLKQLRLSTDLRADNLFALARKTRPPVERYPGFLYVE